MTTRERRRIATRARIMAVLQQHHPVCLSATEMERLVPLGRNTLWNYLHTMELAGLVYVRHETPNERARRGSRTAQHLYGLVEQRTAATFVPRHDLAGLGVLEKMRARQSQEQEL